MREEDGIPSEGQYIYFVYLALFELVENRSASLRAEFKVRRQPLARRLDSSDWLILARTLECTRAEFQYSFLRGSYEELIVAVTGLNQRCHSPVTGVAEWVAVDGGVFIQSVDMIADSLNCSDLMA